MKISILGTGRWASCIALCLDRKKYNVLTNGDTKFLYINNKDVFGFIRFDEEHNNDVLVLINRSNEAQNISISLDAEFIEEIPLKYVPKKYGEIIEKENDSLFNVDLFNININEKSFRLFTLKK